MPHPGVGWSQTASREGHAAPSKNALPVNHTEAKAVQKSPALCVAAVEMRPSFGDPLGALDRLEAVFASPQMDGVDLALLPEAALTGYVSPEGNFDLARFAEPLEGPTAGRLASLARRYRRALAGPLIERDGDRLFNGLLLFDKEGERIGHWRKRHPWYPERWATPGNFGTPVIPFQGLKVAAGICFDVHFVSEDACGALDHSDVFLFPSAWVDDHSDGREAVLPPLARRHGLWVVNANWGCSEPPRRGQGGSRILDCAGQVVARAGEGDGPHIVRALIPVPELG